jgi:hypothetical protein
MNNFQKQIDTLTGIRNQVLAVSQTYNTCYLGSIVVSTMQNINDDMMADMKQNKSQSKVIKDISSFMYITPEKLWDILGNNLRIKFIFSDKYIEDMYLYIKGNSYIYSLIP